MRGLALRNRQFNGVADPANTLVFVDDLVLNNVTINGKQIGPGVVATESTANGGPKLDHPEIPGQPLSTGDPGIVGAWSGSEISSCT